MSVSSQQFPGGLLITLEGLGGSGKSTQAQLLKEWFEVQGYTVVLTREPGGTEFGQKVRDLFLAENRAIVPEAEVGLLLTAKAQLYQTLILPALSADQVVICDRSTDSLFAHQVAGKQFDEQMVQTMLQAFGCTAVPDVTLLFDIDPEISTQRTLARKNAGGDYTTFNAESVEYEQRVRTKLRQRILSRDGGLLISVEVGTIPEITQRILTVLLPRMEVVKFVRELDQCARETWKNYGGDGNRYWRSKS